MRVLLAAILLASFAHAQSTAKLDSVSGIPSYCSGVASYANQHPADALLYAAVPQNRDPARDKWHRISAGDRTTNVRDGNSTAAVTVRETRVVLVDATFRNQFGDYTETVTYCFRPGGTLAQLHSELKSFHEGMKVITEMSFSEAGNKIADTTRSFDLQTNKPKPLASTFWQVPPPVFLKVKSLPFPGLSS